jgi:hypothetical protein
MTRFVPVTVLMVMLAASRIAGAQTATAMFSNGTTVNFSKLEIHDDSKKDQSFFQPDANSTPLLFYFNLAHCNCARVNPDDTTSSGAFKYLVQTSGDPAASGAPAIFVAGTTCEDPTHRSDGATPGTASITCSATSDPLATIDDVENRLFAQGGTVLGFNLYRIVNPTSTSDTPCQQVDSVSNQLYILASTARDGKYEFATSTSVGTVSSTTTSNNAGGIDTDPPPFPDVSSIRATGGDGAIHLTWTAPTDRPTDITHYQALCANVDGSPVGGGGTPQYVTTASVCGAEGGADAALAAIPIAGTTDGMDAGDTAVSAPTGAFGNLEQQFICGSADAGTSNSLDITGLVNGAHYQVILLSTDLHGNYTGGYLTSTVTPVPSTDFWEDLHDRGSHAEGGLCLLAETYGDDSSLTGALRAFRDDTLAVSRAGRWLARAYYASFGKLGGYVHGSLALRAVSGVALAPLVAIALLWHSIGLISLLALLGVVLLWCTRRAWRRQLALAGLGPQRASRLVRLALATAVATVVVLAAGPAHAGGNQPYWEDADQITDNNAQDEPGQVAWRVGFRIGPYTPAIDDQIGGSKPGPFEQMFGKQQHMLVMLDVDRVLWSGFGQLGVGLSLGYWQKTASAFAENTSQTDSDRARAADRNAFRLIPTALSAVYRFTWLDDEYGVPIVPYARAGLAYYLWWISVNNGDFAKICDSTGQMCGNKAYGASLGVQGSIGLAVRAERIDASAAMSMRESGIQHAGIYGELSVAKVDGFGSDKKLSVGDATWFAGVEFEF